VPEYISSLAPKTLLAQSPLIFGPHSTIGEYDTDN
jgi:hypothetical protein